MIVRLTSKKQKAERFGKRGELFARIFLRLKFYKIMNKNYKTPFGEIDIIAKRGRAVVFVEVKARKNQNKLEEALLAVNKRRISKAANYFIAQNPFLTNNDLRFDVIFLAPKSFPYHIISAFNVVE